LQGTNTLKISTPAHHKIWYNRKSTLQI